MFPQVSIASHEIVPVFNNGTAFCLDGSGTILLNELSNWSKQTLFLSLLHCNFVISRVSIRTSYIAKYQRMLALYVIPPAGARSFLVNLTSTVLEMLLGPPVVELLRTGRVLFRQPEHSVHAWKRIPLYTYCCKVLYRIFKIWTCRD